MKRFAYSLIALGLAISTRPLQAQTATAHSRPERRARSQFASALVSASARVAATAQP